MQLVKKKVVEWLNLKKKTKQLVYIIWKSPDLYQDFFYIYISKFETYEI